MAGTLSGKRQTVSGRGFMAMTKDKPATNVASALPATLDVDAAAAAVTADSPPSTADWYRNRSCLGQVVNHAAMFCM